MKASRILMAVLPLMAASIAFGQQIRTTLDGQEVRFAGVQPITVNGRVLVPLRGVFEQMGASVDWEPATHYVFADNNAGRHVQLRIGEHFAKVDGRTVALDTPAIMYRGRTMVPLRFIGEAMGAEVNWVPADRTVAITTVLANRSETTGVRSQPLAKTFTIAADTVIPFKLNQQLTSDGSSLGQKFTATIDTSNAQDYVGLPMGTVVEGHIDAIRAGTSKLPGVLSLAFDDIRLPNGKAIQIDGSLMGLDKANIESQNGRMVARQPTQKNLKYVGIGAGAGALVAIVTKGNIITTTMLGAALGYIYDMTRKPVQPSDVVLRTGTPFGVMLNHDQTFPVYTPN
jgi:hypothetical protein